MFAAADWGVVETADGVVEIAISDASFAGVCRTLNDGFTAVEQDAIRALFLPAGMLPTMADYLEADSLANLVTRPRAAELVDVLDGGGLTAAFQPIVDAHTLAVYAHEGLLRVRPGVPFAGPLDIFTIARRADMLPQVDLAARRTIIAEASRVPFAGKLFINFSPSAIYDAGTCLRTTMEALDVLAIPHDRVVFEVVESDEVNDVGHLTSIMNAYRRAGFSVALDDLGSGFASLNLLHALRPDYVKLDIALVRDVHRDSFKAMLASKLIEAAVELGLTVIAEGIEVREELDWLRDHGAHLAQGFLIARPGPDPVATVGRPDLVRA